MEIPTGRVIRLRWRLAYWRRYWRRLEIASWPKPPTDTELIDFWKEQGAQSRAQRFHSWEATVDQHTIPYDWARVTCPTCGSAPDQRCRTLTTKRVTDAHGRRMQMGAKWRYETSLGIVQ